MIGSYQNIPKADIIDQLENLMDDVLAKQFDYLIQETRVKFQRGSL